MAHLTKLDPYGTLIEPATLKIQRLLPGPIERCWDWITDSDLRRKWLASGVMDLTEGTPFEFTWRNDTLTNPPGQRPEGFSAEHSMKCRIVTVDAPRQLVITWGEQSEVSFILTPQGDEVLLTLIHRRVPDRSTLLNVSSGWHTHLDVLVARARGKEPSPFWPSWLARKAEYDQRLPQA